ncbi:PIN domain-containing protein [bacterium]|nr:PIN domain-containing protein [bacterium]
MDYLADTVAVIRHFSKTGRMGKNARSIFEKTDNGLNTIWISAISIAEIMYLSEKNRINLNLNQFRSTVEDLDNYKILNLSMEIVLIASEIPSLELHDRLIVASAKYLNIPIITCDAKISNQNDVVVLWT